jgi:hypothetical protein
MKLFLAGLVVVSLPVLAQQSGPAAAAPDGLIVGRVVDGTTGAPLPDVTVALSAPAGRGGGPPGIGVTRVLTSAEGDFVFANVAAGRYTLGAAKPGYVNGAYGKASPLASGGASLELAAGERASDVGIPLWKYAAVTGTIVDDAGERLVGVDVRALRRSVVAGRWQLVQAGSDSTDDRGQYRIWSLVPGDYVVAVVSTQATAPAAAQDASAAAQSAGRGPTFSSTLTASGASTAAFGGVRTGTLLFRAGTASAGGGSDALVLPTVFFPGAAAPSGATLITLASGQERAGVDFQLRPMPAVSLSGIILGPDGPAANIGLQLRPADAGHSQAGYQYDAATTISDAAGRFAFLGVTPGDYVIRAIKAPPRPLPSPGETTVVQMGASTISSFVVPSQTPPIPDQPTLWAEQPVSVSDHNASVTVSLRFGARVYGHVQFDGSKPRPPAGRLETIRVLIDPAGGERENRAPIAQLLQARVDEDGNITSYQLPAGRYVIRVNDIDGWSFLNATVGGRDVSDAALDIGASDITNLIVAFTDRPAELSGTVHTTARAPAPSRTVVVFPADPHAWVDYGALSRRFQSVLTSHDGRFSFRAIPDGDYVLATVTGDPSNWQDPERLRRLASTGTPVTVAPGERTFHDLTSDQ